VRASTEFLRAGNWIFGTGIRDRDPKELFQHMAAELDRLGSSMSLVARLDQYYPHLRRVAPYQAARKQAFRRRQVAPSTSVIVTALQDPQAAVDVQVVAATAESGYVVEEIGAGLNRPETSGYSPALRVGDLVFVAGQLARDASGKLAVRGTAAEADYIFGERLAPALEAAGSGPELVLKAQVYVSRPHDVSEFEERWKSCFGGRLPPTTIVPVRHPAFLTTEATVEINVIAAHRSASARVREIESDVPARVLGGLLFTGGFRGNGLEEIMQQAKRVFAAAGSDLSRVVRALVFHPGSLSIADPGFPFTAVEVQGGLTVDLWASTPASQP
jgi:enamine deaminase RidA (YjgF/YER057c/UK114 family)